MIYYHDFSPIAFEVFGLPVRWYGISYAVGILGAFWLASLYINRFVKSFSANDFDDFLPFAVLGIVLGGRLGHAVLYDLELLLAPVEFFSFWKGGMAFHGGIAGVIIAMVVYTHHKRISLFSFADIAALISPFGLFCGRIANFINGELFGRPTNADWGVIFPAGGPILRHPSQLYEALAEGVSLYLFVHFSYMKFRNRPGLTSVMFLLGYAIARFTMEYFRAPVDGSIMAFGVQLSMGQIFTLPMLGGAFIVYLCVRKKMQIEVDPQHIDNP